MELIKIEAFGQLVWGLFCLSVWNVDKAYKKVTKAFKSMYFTVTMIEFILRQGRTNGNIIFVYGLYKYMYFTFILINLYKFRQIVDKNYHKKYNVYR